MMSAREFAAAVVLDNGTVWITGGYDGNSLLQSTEVKTGDGPWTRGVDLPYAVSGHCMVNIPGVGVILIGGWTDNGRTAQTFLFTSGNGWTAQQNMKKARVYHACSTLGDAQRVIVGGGAYNDDDTVEIFNVIKNQWTDGTRLPYKAVYPGRLVDGPRYLHYIGGLDRNEIHKLDVTTNQWVFVSII